MEIDKQLESLESKLIAHIDARFDTMEEKVLEKVLETLEKIIARLPEKRKEREKPKDLLFQSHKKGILATGNTKEHKDKLKKYGGKWNPSLRGWVFTLQEGRRAAEKMKKKVEHVIVMDNIYQDTPVSSSSSDSD